MGDRKASCFYSIRWQVRKRVTPRPVDKRILVSGPSMVREPVEDGGGEASTGARYSNEDTWRGFLVSG